MDASSEQAVYKKETSPSFQLFEQALSSTIPSEEKVAAGLTFLRDAISQEGAPRFREFWEARRQLLALFKGPIPSAIRSRLWNEYMELTAEARRLSELFEEQASFATEQIDLAIQALEKDVAGFDALLAQAREINFPESSTLAQKISIYGQIQRELNLLNTLATRLSGLRKEIFQTDFRIREKTKFLRRLSDLGGHIFPKRKELIQMVSNEFEKDVQSFIDQYFQNDQVTGAPYFVLRSEVKALQLIAKMLTLNSPIFTQTRLKLSACWDQIKAADSERKQEIQQKRQASSEQLAAIQAKITALGEKTTTITLKEIDAEIDQINQEMRQVFLFKEDVRALRDAMNLLRAPHIAAAELKLREKEDAEKERLRIRKEQIAELKQSIEQLLKEVETRETPDLLAAQEQLIKQAAQLDLSKIEKPPIDRALKSLKDLIADRKDRQLLNLSDDQIQALQELRSALQERKELRKEAKDQLEVYRKAVSASDLDFEKSMTANELLRQEKDRLAKIDDAIRKIEQKIAEIERE